MRREEEARLARLAALESGLDGVSPHRAAAQRRRKGARTAGRETEKQKAREETGAGNTDGRVQQRMERTLRALTPSTNPTSLARSGPSHPLVVSTPPAAAAGQ